MRVAIYIRVSAEGQAKEGCSLEMQKVDRERLASKRDYKGHPVFTDIGIKK